MAHATVPTEFILAFSACHVSAAASLLNQDLTTRATFCLKDLLHIVSHFLKAGQPALILKSVNPSFLALKTL
jgi:hypothetical protein